jgi:gas vesicle protein
MAEENGIGKGLIIGFLTGTIVGSIVALLYAPKTGRELRGDIRERTDDLKEDAENYLEQAKVKANAVINDGKKKSEKLIADTKTRVDNLIQEAEKILSEAKDKTGVAVDSSKSKLGDEKEKIKTALKAGVDAYKSEKSDSQKES